jgi:CBS domain-containing protein
MSDRMVSKSMAGRRMLSMLPHRSVWEAASVMSQTNSSSVLVLDVNNQLLGILTERDMITRVLVKALDPKATPVSAVMTRNPMCVRPETTVSQAILLMIERGFRHVPVVAQDGRILGVFSSREAMPREIDAAMTMAQFHQQIHDTRA